MLWHFASSNLPAPSICLSRRDFLPDHVFPHVTVNEASNKDQYSSRSGLHLPLNYFRAHANVEDGSLFDILLTRKYECFFSLEY